MRYETVIAALWVTAVLLRLVWLRFQEKRWKCFLRGQESPHPLTTIGLAVLMLVAIRRRLDYLGEPPNGYLWFVFVGVNLVLLGILINVRFDFRPPWRRQNQG